MRRRAWIPSLYTASVPMPRLKVKLLRNTGTVQLQLPENRLLDDVLFVLDRDACEYDWLVVYSGFNPAEGRFVPQSERMLCHPENTLLITHEPASVRRYGTRFVSQFHWVISCHGSDCLKHPRLISGHPASPWFYRKTYEDILRGKPKEKTALISTFCSDKAMRHTLHYDRLAFTKRFAEDIPELEVYGHGYPGSPAISCKWEGVDPYKYHLAIENHIGRNHWTEKLADAFLGYSLPIYCGCPNVFDFFPEGSLIPIDIMDYKGSLEVVRRTLADGEHEKRFDLICEARRKVIDEHNLFAVIARFVKEHHQIEPAPGKRTAIWNHSGTVRLNPAEGILHAIGKASRKRRFRRFYERRRVGSSLHC